MMLSKIVALSSLSFALSLFTMGCAVGSETHDLPTPRPAKELSAPLSPPPFGAAEARAAEDYRAVYTVDDVAPENDQAPFLRADHEINKPTIPPRVR